MIVVGFVVFCFLFFCFCRLCNFCFIVVFVFVLSFVFIFCFSDLILPPKKKGSVASAGVNTKWPESQTTICIDVDNTLDYTYELLFDTYFESWVDYGDGSVEYDPEDVSCGSTYCGGCSSADDVDCLPWLNVSFFFFFFFFFPFPFPFPFFLLSSSHPFTNRSSIATPFKLGVLLLSRKM